MIDILKQSRRVSNVDIANKAYNNMVSEYLEGGYEVLQEYDDSAVLYRDDDDDFVSIQLVYWCDSGKYSVIATKQSDIDMVDSAFVM